MQNIRSYRSLPLDADLLYLVPVAYSGAMTIKASLGSFELQAELATFVHDELSYRLEKQKGIF